MTALRRFLLGCVALIVLVGALSWWLLSTESGTRFLFARASGFLPPALTIGDVSGTLRTALKARDVRWQEQTTDVHVDRLSVEVDLWRLLDEEIALTRLELETLSVNVNTADAPPEPEKPAAPLDIRLPIRITLQQGVVRDIQLSINETEREIELLEIDAEMDDADLRIMTLSLSSDWLRLIADGRVRLSGRLPVTASIDWQYLELSDWPLAGKLDIGGDLDSYAIEHALRQPVAVQSSGEVALGDGVVVDLENRWESLELEVFDIASRSGVLDLKGTPDALDVSLSATASYSGIPETTIDGEARLTPERASSVSLEARNRWGVAELRGSAGWGDSLQFAFEFGVDEVNVANWAPQISGELATQGRIKGDIASGERNVELEIVSVNGVLNTYPVTGSAMLLLDDQSLTISQLLATAGSNRIVLDGVIGDSVNVAGSVNAETLAAFHPELRGTAEASLTLRGPVDNPTIDLNVATTDLAWQGTAIDRLLVAANGTPNQHSIKASSNAFSTDLVLEVSGAVLDGGWEGRVDDVEIIHPDAGRWSLDTAAELLLRDTAVSLSGLCLSRSDGPGAMCANFSAGETTVFGLEIERVPINLLPLRLPASLQAEGGIYITAEGELKANTLNADAVLDVRGAQLVSTIENETRVTPFPTVRIDAQVSDNRLTGRARTETQEGSLEIEASVASIFDLTSPLNGRAALSIPDLAQLSGLLPALSNPVGVADGELRIAGSVIQPEITGSIQLRDGAFGIRVAGIRVENIDARVSQDAPGTLTLNASATSGDGTMQLRGETIISDANSLSTRLTLTGSRFELIRTPDLQALASPNVTVVVAETETRVSGQLEIPRASVTLKDIPPSAARVSPDAVIHRSGDGEQAIQQRPINIDLNARLGEDVDLAAFGLTTKLQGNLQLRGDARKTISGYGRVSLVEGRFKAYGQDLAIQRGELIFNGPLSRPQLDVRATRDAGGVVAGIQVRGTPDALLSEVFSEPPLRDIEALSYLLTGRPLNQDTQDGNLLGDAAFALGLTGAGNIASRVRSNLGLDTLSIQGGSEDGRIVAGKRLNDRLLVEYGYGIVDRLGTLLLRYQLNDRLVLESRTGVVSNLDLVYRVRKP